MLKNFSFFGIFLEKWPHTRENFQNSVPKGFIAIPINVLCSNFVKFGKRKSAKLCIAYLTKKPKILPHSLALTTVQIVPKICQGQPQTLYWECSRFYPNRFTFGRVISKCVNTIRVCSKVNPIFRWSLASSPIKTKYSLTCSLFLVNFLHLLQPTASLSQP